MEIFANPVAVGSLPGTTDPRLTTLKDLAGIATAPTVMVVIAHDIDAMTIAVGKPRGATTALAVDTDPAVKDVADIAAGAAV